MANERCFAARDDFARWKHPFRDGHILMRRDVLRALTYEALEHLQTEQPSEIGGLLWGNLTSDDSVAVDDSIAITNITFISSSGPLFNTTDADARKIEQAIKHSATTPNLSLLGYFRSHLRDGLQLTPQDQSVIEQQFHYRDSVFLIIKPFDFGICMAGFFFWKEDRLRVDASDLEVSFFAPDILALENPVSCVDEAAITPDIEKRRSTDTGITEVEKQEDRYIVDFLRASVRNSSAEKDAKRRPTSSAPQPAHQPRKQPVVRTLLLWTAAVLALFVAAAVVYVAEPILRSRIQSLLQPTTTAGLDLQVNRSANGQLTLTWNRNSPQLIRPTSATLIITDGGSIHRLQIDNQQLRLGKIVYAPKKPDVQFQMELNSDWRGNSRTVLESVRVMSPGAEKRVSAGRHSNPIVPAAPIEEPGGESSAEVTQSAADSSNDGASVTSSSLRTTQPHSPAPARVAATAPPLSDAAAFVPPRPIEQMTPETTTFGKFARISVKVGIDDTGRVISADLLQNGTPEDPSLAGIAVSAAKRWRFHPATLNGMPVPSDYTIAFAFHPQLGDSAQ